MTRQGGLGSGGGTAASRHPAISAQRRHARVEIKCSGCGQPLASLPFSEKFCTVQCATDSAVVLVPGLYYG